VVVHPQCPFPAQTPTDKNQGSPGGTAPTETKFDFYKVLPEGWGGNEAKNQKPAEPPKAAETKNAAAAGHRGADASGDAAGRRHRA